MGSGSGSGDLVYQDTRLITPTEIEDLAIDVIRARHPEHLAAQERRRGLPPETLERLATVRHLAALSRRQTGDALPACLIGSVGSSADVQRNEADTLDVPIALTVEVSVQGRDGRDVMRRRDWTGWTVAECLLQRLPRNDLVTSIRLRDFETIEEGDAQRIAGAVRFVFEVLIADAISLVGLPVHDDPDWPAGTPGGPPATPYDDPEPLGPAIDIEAEIVRQPIAP